jgi:hypothetical protein
MILRVLHRSGGIANSLLREKIKEKSKPKKKGSCARKTGVAELNRGWTEKTGAWIPTLPKEQPDTKAREARSQPG